MSAASAHRVSGAYEALDVLLVLVLLAAAFVILQSFLAAVRRHRVRRAWLRDFEAEARERRENGQ